MTLAEQEHISRPALPRSRGPLSEGTVEALRQNSSRFPHSEVAAADPYGADLAMALHTCYELHYRGFAEVPAEREWDPELLRFRAVLENHLLAALRAETGSGTDVHEALESVLAGSVSGQGLSEQLRDSGAWWQVQDFFAHRSIYHLKEADPHAWVIPRLEGKAKAALVAVEFDEFGGGKAERIHARLFADLMEAAGLSADYLHYQDSVAAPALNLVNIMSMFGLHRSLRGALLGHFTAAEISTAPSAQSMEEALHRLDAPSACVLFYSEHVEADAVHEQLMRHDVVDNVLRTEPELAADMVFGVRATELLEDQFGSVLANAWQSGTSARRS